MKAFKPYTCFIISVILLCKISVVAEAQDKADTTVFFNYGIGISDWRMSANPIYLDKENLLKLTKAGISAKRTEGNFRRPQEFKNETVAGSGVSGLNALKGWRFYGTFNYHRHYRDSIKYANVARPYDGNPFITADAVGGNWRGDGMVANLQMAFPDVGKWHSGLTVDYETEQSSRNNDPKPLYRLLNYKVGFSVGRNVNKKHLFSLNALYLNSSEHTETGYYTDQNPLLYSIRGYGEFSRGPVVTSQRFNEGWGWRMGTEYRYKNEGKMLLLAIKGGYRTADINDGIAAPIFIGGFDENSGEIILGYEKYEKKRGKTLSVRGWMKDGTGYDPVFSAVNPAYYFSGIDTKLSAWRQPRQRVWYTFAILPSITYTNYYESVAKTDWVSLMLHPDLQAALKYKSSSRTTLFCEIVGGYHFNLQNDLTINRPTILSDILVRPDFLINSADYLKTELNGAIFYNAGKMNWQAEAGVKLLHPVQNQLDIGFYQRNTYHISINLLF